MAKKGTKRNSEGTTKSLKGYKPKSETNFEEETERILGQIPITVILAENDTISDPSKSFGWTEYSTYPHLETHTLRNAPHLLFLEPLYVKQLMQIILSQSYFW